MAQALDRGILLQLQFTPLFTGVMEKDVLALLEGAEVLALPQQED